MALKMGAPYIGDYLKLYDDLIRDVVMSMVSCSPVGMDDHRYLILNKINNDTLPHLLTI